MLLLALFLLLAARAAADCDCGVVLDAPSTNFALLSPLVYPSGDSLLAAGTPWGLDDTSGLNAKTLCYTQLACAGYIWDGVGNAYLMQNSTAVAASVPAPAAGRTWKFYAIERITQYNCTALPLTLDDPYYYYFLSGARSSIELSQRYCPNYFFPGQCCWDTTRASACVDTPTRSVASLQQAWIDSANLHWQEQGHRARLNPSASCQLAPTLLTTASGCTRPPDGCYRDACDTGTRVCSGNGYCIADVSRPGYNFSCDCFYLQTPGQTRAWMGNNCNVSVLVDSGCLNGGLWCGQPSPFTSGLCQSVSLPDQTVCAASQSTFLAQTYLDTDRHGPGCVCDPTQAYTGQYCSISRCNSGAGCGDHAAQGCQIQSDGSWSCACDQQQGQTPWIGAMCDIDATACQNPATGGNLCTSKAQGTCYPANFNASQYSSYLWFSAAQPWCLCSPAYNGQYCQNSNCQCPQNKACPYLSREICNTPTAVSACLPPYGTSSTLPQGPVDTSCDQDLCALSGGIAAMLPGDTRNTTCNCGVLAQGLLQPSEPSPLVDVSCYPRCPEIDGTECGIAGACTRSGDSLVVTNGFTSRTAYCRCPYNWTTLIDPSFAGNTSYHFPQGDFNHGACQLACLHGDVNADVYDATRTTGAGCTTPNCCNCFGSCWAGAFCNTSLCGNGGICDDSGTCQCPDGWTGQFCQTAVVIPTTSTAMNASSSAAQSGSTGSTGTIGSSTQMSSSISQTVAQSGSTGTAASSTQGARQLSTGSSSSTHGQSLRSSSSSGTRMASTAQESSMDIHSTLTSPSTQIPTAIFSSTSSTTTMDSASMSESSSSSSGTVQSSSSSTTTTSVLSSGAIAGIAVGSVATAGVIYYFGFARKAGAAVLSSVGRVRYAPVARSSRYG